MYARIPGIISEIQTEYESEALQLQLIHLFRKAARDYIEAFIYLSLV
jgi:hypothetical protein